MSAKANGVRPTIQLLGKSMIKMSRPFTQLRPKEAIIKSDLHERTFDLFYGCLVRRGNFPKGHVRVLRKRQARKARQARPQTHLHQRKLRSVGDPQAQLAASSTLQLSSTRIQGGLCNRWKDASRQTLQSNKLEPRWLEQEWLEPKWLRDT